MPDAPKNDKYIIVINKTTGLTSSIRSKSFDDRFFSLLSDGVPTKLPTETQSNPPELKRVPNLEELNHQYEAKFGKSATGRWAADGDWLLSKIQPVA